MNAKFPGMSVSTQISSVESREIWDLWVKHGGTSHGPHTEHVSMEMDAFWRFIDALLDSDLADHT